MLRELAQHADYDAATASFNAIGDARLAELESICPARVPMREIAAFVRAKGAEITDAPISKILISRPERGRPECAARCGS